MRKLLFAVFSFFIVVPLAFSGQQERIEEYKKAIPPEILDQYEPAIVQGERPKLVRITEDMIWDLRNKPDQGGDVYSFDLNPDDLSTVQKEVIREWVKNGTRILFWGIPECKKYDNLFSVFDVSYETGWEYKVGPVVHELNAHAVNTDVSARYLCFVDYDGDRDFGSRNYYATVTPENTEKVVENGDGKMMAGRIPYGNGAIYVALMGNKWSKGTDRFRWELNFKQWMLGYKVPGAAKVRITGHGQSHGRSKQGSVKAYDRIQLKNGDTVSGMVATSPFTVETSYATLSFDPKEIDNIVYEGSGANIGKIILHNGDELSGKLGPDGVDVNLQGGQKTTIEKDKIKEIVIQAKREDKEEAGNK